MRVAIFSRGSGLSTTAISQHPSLRVRHLPQRGGSRYRRRANLAASGVDAFVRHPWSITSAWRSAREAGDERVFASCLEVIGFRPDVCYFADPLAARAWRPLLRMIPSVVSVPPWTGGWTSTEAAEVLRMASIVHCMFDADAEALRDEVPSARIEQAWAGFAPVRGRPIDIERRGAPAQLVAAGHLDWRAEVEDVLIGVRRLLDDGTPVRLVWFGSGPDHMHAVHARHDLDLCDIVEFRRRFSLDEVTDALQQAQAFVQLDLLGGLDGVGLTAMSLGVPLVKYEGTEAEPFVRTGREGIVVAVGDVAGVTTALASLIGDPERASELGTDASSRLHDVFGSGRQGEEFVRLFRRAQAVGPMPPWDRKAGARSVVP